MPGTVLDKRYSSKQNKPTISTFMELNIVEKKRRKEKIVVYLMVKVGWDRKPCRYLEEIDPDIINKLRSSNAKGVWSVQATETKGERNILGYLTRPLAFSLD